MKISPTCLVLFFTLCQAVASFGNAPQAPTDLRIEYLKSPVLGVDVTQPRFSWILQHSDRAQQQTAYQILVSANPSVNAGDIWDSGKTASNFSNQILYKGSKLTSDTSYFWKVRWWDANGVASPYSSVASFDTGYFSPSEWNATWIGGYNILRTEFKIQPFNRARAFICGLGYYELYINGRKVGDSVLDPGWTNYKIRSLYVVHDVGQYLQEGANAIGVMLGKGWYGQGWGEASRLIFQLSLDGSLALSSSLSWKGTEGPIVFDSVYNGETYDARLEEPGWTEPYFDDSEWKSVVEMDNPTSTLSAALIPPIKILKTLKPLMITHPKPGKYVFDFGQNFSGFTKLKVKGTSGTTVVLRHAEILQHNKSGMIYTDNLRSAQATDTYILKGDPKGETYMPRFTYHGFRFVEVSGYPGIPTLDSLEGIHIASSLDNVGQINFNSDILNRIQSNVFWGQQSNLMSVPTDCDQRDERLGWMADGHLSADEAVHNFDMSAFYFNWIRLIGDDTLNGEVPDVVPFVRYGGRPGDPAWSSAFPILLTTLWKYYGDTQVLSNSYDIVKEYTDFMIEKALIEGIQNLFASYGDWVPPPPAPKVSAQFTASWFFLLGLKEVINIGTILGKTDDVSQYTFFYKHFLQPFNDAFFDYDKNIYDNGVQTGFLLPLHLGLVPLDNVQNVIKNLLNDIVTVQQTHLTTGILGTKYLPLVLSQIGRSDIALELALQTTYPSWGYMIYQTKETPATTFWELWDSPDEGPGMNSRNHIMFGSVGAWFYSDLCGIKQQPGGTGYYDIVLQPPTVDVLLNSPITSVNCSTSLLNGQVALQWIREGGSVGGQAVQGHTLTLTCQGGGEIENIEFASFGNPQGHFGGYFVHPKCHAENSLEVVAKYCIGQTTCSIEASTTLFDDPCPLWRKHLTVQARCSNEKVLRVNAQVPVNVQAQIHISKLDFANVTITESGNLVWVNGKFNPVSGISAAEDRPGSIVFSAGSGNYQFAVSGSPSDSICVTAMEGSTIDLACPLSHQVIRHIKFASFGTPSLSCDSLQYGDCHAGSSKHVVENLCLYQNSCSVTASDEVFGDSCEGDVKNLAVEALCS